MKFLKMVMFAILAMILLCIISIDTFRPKPFSLGHSNLKGSPFEGFSRMQYTEYPSNSAIDSMQSNSIIQSTNEVKVKLDGYGLLASPEVSPTIIDIYSGTPSSPESKSYGLTNSRGFLTLSSEQLRLLRTRGGNITGPDSTIGG
jgi:hypothetical protein